MPESSVIDHTRPPSYPLALNPRSTAIFLLLYWCAMIPTMQVLLNMTPQASAFRLYRTSCKPHGLSCMQRPTNTVWSQPQQRQPLARHEAMIARCQPSQKAHACCHTYTLYTVSNLQATFCRVIHRRPPLCQAAGAGSPAIPPPPAQGRLERLADVLTMLFPVWVSKSYARVMSVLTLVSLVLASA